MSTFPFPSSDKPCELYCSPLGKESPLLVADRVLDGTPCGPYETDLCVHGKCQVTCFRCVFGGEAPSPPEGFQGGEVAQRSWEAWRGDGSSQEGTSGHISCNLAPLPPSAATEHEAHPQANWELRWLGE